MCLQFLLSLLKADTLAQPYVKHVKEIARLMKLRKYEPEVALAVRIPRAHTSETTDDQRENGNGDIDSMLMSHGFEYVDATNTEDHGAENGMEEGMLNFSIDSRTLAIC